MYDIGYVLESANKPVICPTCGNTELIQQKPKDRRSRDLSSFGHRVGLIIKGHMYKCKKCGELFMQKYKSIPKGSRYTLRLKNKTRVPIQNISTYCNGI